MKKHSKMLGTLCLVAFFSSVIGHLEFVDLHDTGVSSSCLTVFDSKVTNVPINPPVQLGSHSARYLQISAYGKIAIPNYQGPYYPNGPFSSTSYSGYIIAPFWTRTYFSYFGGSVCYQVHSYDSSARDEGKSRALMYKVGEFINDYVGYYVSVLSLVVVEWKNLYSDNEDTNTFQALIAVTNWHTFAIFTYKCGELQWSTSSAVIGFNAGDSLYRNHPFSRNNSDINPIACVNYPESVWSNVVYQIDSAEKCTSNLDFGCTIQDCIPRSQVCDGINQCVDKSDEIACSPVVNCPPDKFGCNDGKCIDSTRRCDGRHGDCLGGEDEVNCNTGIIAGVVIGSLALLTIFIAFLVVFIVKQVKHRKRRRAQFQVLRESVRPPSEATAGTQSVHYYPKPGEWYRTVEGTMVQGPPPAYEPAEEVELIGGSGEDQALIGDSEQPTEPAVSPQGNLDSTMAEENSNDTSSQVGVANDEGLSSSGSFESETTHLIT